MENAGEENKMNNIVKIINGEISYNNNNYVKKEDNFNLPKLICSLATDELKDINTDLNIYGYYTIKILKKNAYLTENAKSLLGFIVHKSILYKNYMIELDVLEALRVIGWNEKSIKTHKKEAISKLHDILFELKSFTISCYIKNKGNKDKKYVFAGLILNAEMTEDKVKVIVDPTYFELHNNDVFHLSGDIFKINSDKSENANKIYKVLLTNNFNPRGENKVYLNDLLHTLQLNSDSEKTQRRTCTRALDSLMKGGKVKMYKINKTTFSTTVMFQLNPDYKSSNKTLNAVKTDDTYSCEGEYETFESEPENAQIVSDRSDELPEGHEKIFTNSFDVEEEVEDEFPF